MKSVRPRPSWLPDWKTHSYPKADGEEYVNWRWEFLRRNSQYQLDWETIAKPHYDAVLCGFRDGPDFFPHFRKQYGLAMPIPSDDNNPGNCFLKDWFRVSEVVTPGSPKAARRVSIELRDYQIAMVFDLRRSLPAYIERAGRYLERQQAGLVKQGMKPPPIAKPHRGQFPLYLRLLDAVVAGAKPTEIAATCFPSDNDPSQKVKAGLKAARIMRDEGFWDLPSR